MYIVGMSLQVHLVRQNNLTEVALDLFPFPNIRKVLPLEVFAEITWGMKRIYALFDRQVFVA